MAATVDSRKASSFELAIERKLADTCRRIRLFDAGASLLLLGSGVLAYALVFAIVDLAVGGADVGGWLALRWLAYLAFLAVAGAVAFQVLKRLMQRVNPYYAARRLEETVPEAKNSVISWLDLKEENLPAALRKTIGGKAAQDLKEADPENAIERKPTWIMLAVFAMLLLGMLGLLAVRPGQFLSLMQRAFLPFYNSRLAGETRITLLRPESGDVVVTEKQAVMFAAQIEGRISEINQPGAPALYYRYQEGDKFVVQPLQRDLNGQWTTRIAPEQVGAAGFWYKIVAGDAETPLYQVSVRAQPGVQRYEVIYTYRPYLNLLPEVVAFPNAQAALPFIKRYQGTEVSIVVRTNRALRQGGLKLVIGKNTKDLPTQVLKDDPQAFRCRWTLEQSGEFYVSFISTESETYESRTPFPVEVLVDAAPVVEWTHPKQNVELPANGTLEVFATADDDLGLKDLTLHLELVEAGQTIPLKSQRYRPEVFKDWQNLPVHIDYFDAIKLDELRTALDQPLALRTDVIVRYWLEATDNSDYPNKAGNVGKSLRYEIKIKPPQDDQSARKEREAAANNLKKHNAKQDQKLADDKEKKDQAQAAKNAGDGGKGGPSPDEKKAEKLGNDLKNDLDKFGQKSPASDKGEGKGDQPDRAQSKEGGGDGADAPSPDQKDEKPGDPNQAGNSKAGPQPGSPDAKPGETKDGGPGNGNQAGGGQSDPMQGASKDAPKESPGQSRGEGPGESSPEKGSQPKAGPDPKAGESPQAKGAGSDAGQEAPGAQSKPGQGVPMSQPPADQPPQGLAKPEEANGPKSISKHKGPETGMKSLDPQLKDAAEKTPGEEIGSGKTEGQMPPKEAAKEGPGIAKDAGPSTADAKNQEPTPAQVEHLKELMKRKDGLGDWAAKTLEQMSKEAPDPKVRELAKDALDQAGPRVFPGEKSQGPTDPKIAGTKPPPNNPNGNPNEANPGKSPSDPATQIGKAPGKPDQPPNADVKGNAGTNPGVGSRPDDLKADPARKDLSRFGGNLQLEDFLKRATPEYRAKAGISDDDWQQLLTKAAKYDELLRKLQIRPKSKTPIDARGTPGKGAGPGAVQLQPDASQTLDAGQAQVPPELLDAHRRFKGP